MKKQFLIIVTFLTFGLGYSQNTFPTAANTAVGIGTGTTAVSGTGGLRLKVTSGVANTSGVQLTNLTSASPTTTGLLGKALSVNATGNLVLVPVTNTSTNLFNSDGVLTSNRTVTMNSNSLIFNPSTPNSEFFINGVNGNIGIGNMAPSEKLDVNGVVKASQGLFTNSSTSGGTFVDIEQQFRFQNVINAGNLVAGNTYRRQFTFADYSTSNLFVKPTLIVAFEDRNDMNRFKFTAETNGFTKFYIQNKSQEPLLSFIEDGSDNVSLVLSKANSFLGIGTTNFIDGSDIYRLSVKGAIRAERVKVYTTWADFVFEKDYSLPSLEDVEKHIQEKGHLKDIPSAQEVEANGIELGEMNKKLLQKIEELTLYIIEINKELKEVKSQLKND